MEVVWDLDTEAAKLAAELGIALVRAKTPGTHREIIAMVRELVAEHTEGATPRALGPPALAEGQCAPDCCPAPAGRPPARVAG